VHFEATVKLLRQRGTTDTVDVQLAKTYAINLELRDVAYGQLQKDGAFVMSDRGNMSDHPAVAVIAGTTMRIKQLAESMGLTPGTAMAPNASAGQPAPTNYDAWKARLAGGIS
jgi:P27 family predicted phage terminase small subunit